MARAVIRGGVIWEGRKGERDGDGLRARASARAYRRLAMVHSPSPSPAVSAGCRLCAQLSELRLADVFEVWRALDVVLRAGGGSEREG